MRSIDLVDILTVIVPYGVLVAVILWIGWGRYARHRKAIAYYIDSEGGILLSATWAPFAPGWIGERNDAIYAIKYYDAQKQVQQAYAKVSQTGTVYLRRR
ncbi:MAG TPA: hypothetical protein PKH77_14325 [Anaerolineae bacterium]|nr:hypothetical protein [Anaerolineae bacterium]